MLKLASPNQTDSTGRARRTRTPAHEPPPEPAGPPADESQWTTPGDDALDGGAPAARGTRTAADPGLRRTPEAPAPGPDEAAPAPERSADSPAEPGWAAQRWQALRQHLPYIAQRDARRRALAWAQQEERRFAEADAADNAAARLPAGEQARIQVIWLAELFTPTTIPGLIGGMRDLTRKQTRVRSPYDDDPVEWITSNRRLGESHWLSLPIVRPAGFPLDGHQAVIVDQVPAGITYIRLSLHALTSTVTALTAEFWLEDDRARELEDILNREFATRAKLLPNGGHRIFRVGEQKVSAVEEWRRGLRQDAASWLAKRFPGTFHRLAPGQLPTIEFLLTSQQRPWEPPTGASGWPGWMELLDLPGWRGDWRCATTTNLRLQERSPKYSQGQRHRLVLAGLEQEIQVSPWPFGNHLSTYEAVYMNEDFVTRLLARWSLTALIRELEERLARILDVADQASRDRSPRALADTQQLLVQTGIDSRIVVNDIVRYAQDPGWKNRVLDFAEVVPQELLRELQREAKPSLAESLRQGQITDGQRVSGLEEDLREVLSTSAELTSASENLRLQRRVIWLTVIAVIVAIVAAAAAVIALTNSSGPGATPSTHTTNSSLHAPASPRRITPD